MRSKYILFVIIALLLAAGCARQGNVERAAADQTPAPSPAADERVVKLLKVKDAVAPFFKPMGEPDEYDWLARNEEPGQTFEQYAGGRPTLPTETRRVIYIQPMGEFTPTQQKAMALVADYMRAFFQLPVTLNPVAPLGDVPAELQRVYSARSARQIRTTYFLDTALPPMLPADAAAFLCFTNEDLYPGDEWYFVFGQASLESRLGVWSLHRLGEPDKSEKDYKKFLARTLKIAMHETGHMFTMQHCTKYECLMSGTNHLGETDRRPLDACPECAAKISWAMNYEPAARYRRLAAFWKRENWPEEEKAFNEKAAAVE